MTKTYKAIFTGLLAQLFLGGTVFAAGISVDPSYVRVADLELKDTTRVQKESGFLLKINNREATPAVFTVSVLACKEMNIKPNGGYEDFPDVKWFVFRSTEIAVPAGGTGVLPYLELKAPKDKKYLNKRWQALLKVAQQGKDFLGAEAVLPLWLETKTEKKPAKTSGDKKHGN